MVVHGYRDRRHDGTQADSKPFRYFNRGRREPMRDMYPSVIMKRKQSEATLTRLPSP